MAVFAPGQTISFTDIVTTKRGCAGPQGQVEATMLNMLRANGVTFALDAQTLTLQVGNQGIQLRGG